MEYNIKELAKLAHISKRTLRYYDEIGLLSPKRMEHNDYRIYGQREVDLLYQILQYRALDLSLEEIKQIVLSPMFDELQALEGHLQALQAKKSYYESLIDHVEKTIAAKKGNIVMTNEEKFEGFKKKLIEENEMAYGSELRERYGADEIEESNAKLMGLSAAKYEEMMILSSKWHELLKEAMRVNDPACSAAQEACLVHKEWLSIFWEQYSKEAHLGLAQMYVDDIRFKSQFEKIQPGFAVFFLDAMNVYCMN